MGMNASNWKMFPWAPDGTYDNNTVYVRYVLVDGMPETVITKEWLDKGGPNDVSEELKQPWGAFPDMPPKPEKK